MALSLKNYTGTVTLANEARFQEILNLLPNKGKLELNDLNDIREELLRDGADLSEISIDYGYVGKVPIVRKPGWHNKFIFALASSRDTDQQVSDGYDALTFIYFTMSEGEIEWTDISPNTPDRLGGLNNHSFDVVEENLQEYLDYEHNLLVTLDGDNELMSVLNI
jgi:hypothetical protein